jgi:flagellin-like hook-associated protein FlgL
MSDITLSMGVRQNLLSLQKTADLMATTQNRLATGKKVNSALDNPTNFFTSQSLQTRANDLASLLDSMSNGVKTLEAADNGLTAITKNLESMQSTLRQARQDKSFQTTSYSVDLGATPAGTETLSFSGGAVGATAVDIELTESNGVLTGAAYTALDFDNAGAFGETLTFDIAANGGTAQTVVVEATDATTLSITVDGGSATTFTVADANAVTGTEFVGALNAAFDAAATPVPVEATFTGGAVVFTSDDPDSTSTAGVAVTNVAASAAPVLTASFGFDGGGTPSVINTAQKSVDTLVDEINTNTSLIDKIRASNDNGKLRIENQSTQELTVTGVASNGITVNGGTGTAAVGGNEVRTDLATQFNLLRDQLDKLADDSSFNGVNLLRGDNLKINFNETGTSTLNIQTKDGKAINSYNLGLSSLDPADLDSDDNIDAIIADVSAALDAIRSQSSAFGSNLSMVENRQDFTKAMKNTLETGADNLVLADTNEEGANMLALQTRQQLSSVALSLASEADQAVLRLF